MTPVFCQQLRGLRVLFSLIAFSFALSFFAFSSAAQTEEPLKVSVDWNAVTRVSNTTISLQVVVNPPLRRGSVIHDAAWNSLRELRADSVRFVPWYPYPLLGVAELKPPSAQETFWDFSLIDPLVADFFSATEGRPIMLNFSTIPQWMFQTGEAVPVPSNADEPDWAYEQGLQLRDPSAAEVADYYARLAAWYTRGGFADELGRFHASDFHYKIALWEVLNEPEYEHALSPKDYTTIYDAVVASVRRVLPDARFVGMSLAEPSNSAVFFEYFLDPGHHKPGIPLDFISYHFYAVPTADQSPSDQQFTFFDQADKFLSTVHFIEAIRQRLSPQTRTAINETGCILPADINQGLPGADPTQIPDSYWNLCGSMFAYLFVGLARQGIDIVSSSQLLGYPTQFPSVTMLDWRTGKPNARYRVLKLLHDNFALGDELLSTKLSSPYLAAQAFRSKDGMRKLLLVNKRDRPLEIAVDSAHGAQLECVDLATGAGPPALLQLSSDTIRLKGFAVAVVTFKQTAALAR